MKIILLTITGIFFCSILFAQDTILLRNGNEIRAKVLEIGADEIKYINFNDPDGLILYLSKSDIFMIKYQNGTKTVMQQKTHSDQMYPEPFMKAKKVSKGMEATKFFIGYDILKGIIDENSLTYGYKFEKHQFITASIGFTYYNKTLIGLGSLSPDQTVDPLMVYKGPTYRASYNLLITRSFYIGLDIFYKHLYYTAHNFEEAENDGDPTETFERSEDAKVWGWHIDIGGFINNQNSRFYINPYFGVGQTTKWRTYTTTDEYPPFWVDPWLPIGTFSQTLQYISYNLGLNMGVKF